MYFNICFNKKNIFFLLYYYNNNYFMEKEIFIIKNKLNKISNKDLHRLF